MISRFISIPFWLVLSAHVTASAQVQPAQHGYEYIDDDVYEGLRLVGNNGKYGMVNSAWKEVVPCVADRDMFPDGRYVIAEIGGKYGLYDTSGRQLLPGIYDHIRLSETPKTTGVDNITLEMGEKKGMADNAGKVIIPVIYDQISDIGGRYLSVRNDGRFGIIAPDNRSIAPCVYKQVGSGYGYPGETTNYFPLQDTNNKWGLVDTLGREVIPFIFDDMTYRYNAPVLVMQNGKWGAKSLDGKDIIPLRYDGLWYSEGVFEVKTGNKWGLTDSNGSIILPCIYSRLDVTGHDCVFAEKDKKWGCFDLHGKEIYPQIFDGLDDGFFSEGCKVSRDGKWGLLDSHLKWIAPCEYEDVKLAYHHTLTVKTGEGWGVLDSTGRLVISCKYTRIEKMCNGYYMAHSPSGWKIVSERRGEVGQFEFRSTGNAHDGYTKPFVVYPTGMANIRPHPPLYIDTNGTIQRLPSEKNVYEQVGNFSEGMALVKDDQEYYGYINSSGALVIEAKYEHAGDFVNGLAAVQHGGKYGYINKEGVEVIKCMYNDAKPFTGNKATVSIDYKWGVIDRAGNTLVPCMYEKPVIFKEGLMIQYEDRGEKRPWEWSVIDTAFRTVADLGSDLSDTEPFSEGLAIAREHGMYSYYVNRDGSRPTDCKYFRAHPFSNGKACVAVIKYKPYSQVKAGFINPKGEKLGEFSYFDLYPLAAGELYAAKKYTGYGLVDHEGKEHGSFDYSKIKPAEHGEKRYAVAQNKKWGYLDQSGMLVIPMIYDDAMPFAEGLAAVKQGDSWLYIDTTGKTVLRFKAANSNKRHPSAVWRPEEE